VRNCVVALAPIAFVALVGCRGESKPAPTAEAKPAVTGQPAEPTEGAGSAMDPGHCEQQPFAAMTPLPEASGAAWMTIDGKLAMVVVADSGNDGEYVVLDPETGDTREQGKLPLGKGGDDVEGLAEHGGKLFGLTSAGEMRVWQRNGKGFELVDGPYSVGDDSRLNYEGLALAAKPQAGCAGFACSKADGAVYCLGEHNGRYAIDEARRIDITKDGALADCTFDERDQLWVGNNVFGSDQVFRVDGWADPASAKVVATNAFGVGFPEVIAVRGDVIYRLSDTGGAPSLMAKFRCSNTTR
jgi:hypothetical protein